MAIAAMETTRTSEFVSTATMKPSTMELSSSSSSFSSSWVAAARPSLSHPPQHDQLMTPHLENNFRMVSLNDAATGRATMLMQSTYSSSTASSATTTAAQLDGNDDDHDDYDYWPHHHNPQTQQVRSQMITVLEKMVRQKCKTEGTTYNDDDNRSSNTRNSQRLVGELERILWRQSKHNIEAYSDTSTIHSRLQSIMKVLLLRRIRRNNSKGGHGQQQQQSQSASSRPGPSSSSSSSSMMMDNRSKTLLHILGEVRYQRAKVLVRSIKDAKLQYMTRHTKTCCSNTKTCSLNSGGQHSLPTPILPKSLPLPVKRLYFSTGLVPVFEKAPLQSNQNSDHVVEWDRLLQEAEDNLRMFQKWCDGNTLD